MLTAQELRGGKECWLNAIDMLIESRGTCCYLPLPVGAGQNLFPEVHFQKIERVRCQDELRNEKYSRRRRKELCQRERAYQALAGQAEIDLSFHTPDTVSSWSSRWSGTTLSEYDLESMFWRWSERFRSLAALERGEFVGEPFWCVTYEAAQLAREAHAAVVQLERWMVPNKLIHREGVSAKNQPVQGGAEESSESV